jgi:hypothetical protein
MEDATIIRSIEIELLSYLWGRILLQTFGGEGVGSAFRSLWRSGQFRVTDIVFAVLLQTTFDEIIGRCRTVLAELGLVCIRCITPEFPATLLRIFFRNVGRHMKTYDRFYRCEVLKCQ